MRKIFSIIVLSFLSFALSATIAKAADCTIIYGGGETSCSKVENATTSPTGQPQKKFTVYPTTKVTKTPATGPETLALISLIPMAATGWLLRKKTK